MTLKKSFSRLINLSLTKMCKKGFEASRRKINEIKRYQADLRRSTYSKLDFLPHGDLFHFLSGIPIEILKPYSSQISLLTDFVINHCFNLLGSGWVGVNHHTQCAGVEGYRYEMGKDFLLDEEGRWLEGRINQANLKDSQHIWHLLDPHYIPIDWQLDFKSGFRWSENTWYLDIPFGHMPGVDIKVPWELARMQHLPLLVWAFILARENEPGFQPSQVYIREFRNQVLDFIMANPPRFGVNWRSPMDVGIRVANWLITYDLFRAYDVEFDNEFKKIFFRSIYEHGLHVINNLEWNEELRANHYLSNIVSLLFIAAYLPCTPETNVLLAIAVQELISEVGLQFNFDGTNFEGSTSYHRLSAEMVIYATALVFGFPEEKKEGMLHYDDRLYTGCPKLKSTPVSLYLLHGTDISTPFPDWYIERLEKMAEFTMDSTKPNGQVIQIGDNDSGRFLKLHPVMRQLTATEVKTYDVPVDGLTNLLNHVIYWNEDHLDHRHVVAAINGLFDRKDFTQFTNSGWVETSLVKQLARGIHLPSHKRVGEFTIAEQRWINGSRLPQRLKLSAYPDFGLHIFRSKDVYLGVRCGSIGQNGRGGHAHNDSLSFELNIRKKDFFVDGGSYLYTPLLEIRNMFRSTRAHNTLTLKDFEQNYWNDGLRGLFSMRNDAQASVLELSIGYLKGKHHGFGPTHYRQFELRDYSLIIEDYLETDRSNEINFNLAPDVKVILIRENGAMKYILEMDNGGVQLEMHLEGFHKMEIYDGFFSLGYGNRLRNSLLKCYRSTPRTKVEIKF